MSNQTIQASAPTFPFFGLLGLIFITLKLTGFIGWSWWLVLLPLYGPIALGLVILLVAALIAGLATAAPHIAKGYRDAVARNQGRA